MHGPEVERARLYATDATMHYLGNIVRKIPAITTSRKAKTYYVLRANSRCHCIQYLGATAFSCAYRGEERKCEVAHMDGKNLNGGGLNIIEKL
jgi:hypothetical protein